MPGERAQVLRGEFLEVLASVPDPRDPRGRRYWPTALLAIAILATAAGDARATLGLRALRF